MDITEVRIKLVENNSERLRAFCSITLDGDFVIRDLKIIDGTNGPFVAMPSRKLMDRCTRCGAKNHMRAKFCNECGNRLSEARAPRDSQGRSKLHADVAHPINAPCRERIQNAVVAAYHEELEKAKSPDYMPPTFDDFEDYDVPAEPHPPVAVNNPSEPVPVGHGESVRPKREGGFSEYDSLIADLKRDAETRRDRRHDRDRHVDPTTPADDDEPAERLTHPAEPGRHTDRDVSEEPHNPARVTSRTAVTDDFGAGL